MERVTFQLTQMHALLPHVPDASMLVYGPAAYPFDHAGGSSDDPGRLPHGLDLVTDDWETGNVRTADGVRAILHDVATEWAEHVRITPPPAGHPYVAMWLAELTARAHEVLDADTWQASAETISLAYAHTRRLTGRTPYRTDLTCPYCGSRMTRPATRDGIAELLDCQQHGRMTTAQYLTAVRATTSDPNLVPDTWPVTTAEAAEILDIPYHTADYRRRARGIAPVRRSRNNRYPLHAFYPLDDIPT